MAPRRLTLLGCCVMYVFRSLSRLQVQWGDASLQMMMVDNADDGGTCAFFVKGSDGL